MLQCYWHDLTRNIRTQASPFHSHSTVSETWCLFHLLLKFYLLIHSLLEQSPLHSTLCCRAHSHLIHCPAIQRIYNNVHLHPADHTRSSGNWLLLHHSSVCNLLKIPKCRPISGAPFWRKTPAFHPGTLYLYYRLCLSFRYICLPWIRLLPAHVYIFSAYGRNAIQHQSV